jgi:putative cardiolipin synthase
LLTLLPACATRPIDRSGVLPSYALSDTADTVLGRRVEPAAASHPGQSGFHLLSNGLDAFVARAVLVQTAQRSLDLQYYIFHGDKTGLILLQRLLAAADRGVRVRLLLDDWGTASKNDANVAALATHPNVRVRFFNPYVNRSGLRKLGEMITSFSRVNRRMHNKLFIADNQAVVLGGRNIGDEYFAATDVDFQDVDVVGFGPIARDASASFDRYWNSEFAIPPRLLVSAPPGNTDLDRLRARLSREVDALRDSPYARALLESDLARSMREHNAALSWASATLFYDRPDKIATTPDESPENYLGPQLAPHNRSVQKELLLVSPYFVPGELGVRFFGSKAQDGVKVKVLTNSLAATDVWLVHAGYMNYRKPLLQKGVELYELKPAFRADAGVKRLVGSSRASLHGKTFVYDRRSVFIGSVNIDPRSIKQNTEVGVLVMSQDLAQQVAALFERWTRPDAAYRVELVYQGARGEKLVWVGEQDGQPVELTSEPEAGFWRRFGAGLFSLLPIESQI